MGGSVEVDGEAPEFSSGDNNDDGEDDDGDKSKENDCV